MNKPVFAAAMMLVSTWGLLPASSGGAEVAATEKGVIIDAGSLGEFVLTYPAFEDAGQKPAHKLIETKTDKNTVLLKYEGGGTVDVSIRDKGEIAMKLAGIPDDVKSMEVTMLIEATFSKGGAWKIGETEGVFPREKPAKPHLFQGHAAGLKIMNAQGQSLSLGAPEGSYLQLTDNREWNWNIYAWKCKTPLNFGIKELKFSVSADLGKAQKKLVDSLGQTTLETWPDKLKSADELKADAESEKAYYASLKPPAWDKYGGLPGSGAKLGLKKTGFFHVEKHGEKWWLVDPEGNAFFHTGVCCFGPGDDYTYTKGREDIYEWLPTVESEFKTAFRPDSGSEVVSFHLVNQIRKFGQPYRHDEYAARMIGRARKWGFNSIGAFSAIPPTAHQAASFPYVTSLALDAWDGVPRIPGVHETFDPFDKKTVARIKENLAKTLPARLSDPLLIGYFIVNEPRYDELPKVLPSLDGKQACKRRLVETLRDKYQTIAAFNTAWQAQAKSFEELNDAGLAVKTAAATEDIKAFTGLFLETYFELVSSTFRQHDKNHLLVGSRLQPVTIDNEQMCRISGKYLDIMSFNYYTPGPVDKELLARIYQWTGGRPMMLSEFFWSSPRDSGLAGGREVRGQQERGLAYRNYVEQAASLGFVIGIEWFTLVDQSVTGRWFSKYSGESGNTGLISVTDRPWKPMLEEMMKTNYSIFEVLLGERKPFSWEQPAPAAIGK